MTTTHTPGPWTAAIMSGSYIVTRGATCMASCRGTGKPAEAGYRYLTKEQIANARLISAAPDLLEERMEICEALLVAENEMCLGMSKDLILIDLISRFKNSKAVAKAEGKSDG